LRDGNATAPFLEAGYHVTAVEIGRNMTEFLLERFKAYNNFNVITSTFEDVSLDSEDYDLIYAASAFHWVDAEIGCPKVFRYSYYVSKERPVRKSRDDYAKPSEIRKIFGFDSLERFGFCEVVSKLYDASRTYTVDEYLELLDTFSDHRGLPAGLRKALYDGVKEVILRHGGYHKVDYVFQLYMGRKP